MSRTNIDIDDDLIAQCMGRFDLPTKRSAVEFALRRLISAASDAGPIHATAGIGWEDDREADEDATW